MRTIPLIAFGFLAGSSALSAQDGQTAARGSRENPIMVTRVSPASDPAPANNPGTWVTTEDYPSWAVRYEVDGMVRFSVDVDETGRVTGCEIVGSSGVPELDELTCAKISERAVFRPARDAKGNAVAGKWSNTVRWQIPSNKTATAPAPGAFVVNILIERDGTVSSCKVERAEGAAEKTGASLCAGAKTFAPILDSNGEPQRTRVRTSMRIELESVPDE